MINERPESAHHAIYLIARERDALMVKVEELEQKITLQANALKAIRSACTEAPAYEEGGKPKNIMRLASEHVFDVIKENLSLKFKLIKFKAANKELTIQLNELKRKYIESARLSPTRENVAIRIALNELKKHIYSQFGESIITVDDIFDSIDEFEAERKNENK